MIEQPCPFCGGPLEEATYDSFGTHIICYGCNGEFLFPAFPNEVMDMWEKYTKKIKEEDE